MNFGDVDPRWFWPPMFVAVPAIIGVWTLFGSGMLLGWLGDFFDRWLHPYIAKPLYACLPCMASTWGTAVWFIMGGSVEISWPVFCLALCGILKIVSANLLRHE